MFTKTFGCVRFIYNKMLEDRLTKTPAAYKKVFEWLKEVDCFALCNAQMNLMQAFRNHKRNPKHFRAPHFKSRRNRQSYSTNNQRNKIRIENGKLRLPKVGWIKIVAHRKIEGIIKSVTVVKNPSNKYYNPSNKYYVSILVEYENQVLKVVPKNFVGLDYSMHELYVSSDGQVPNYPRFYRKSEKKLIGIHRKFSRKVRGSHNWEKFRCRLSKAHERVANQRRDFLHKLSAQLVERYDAICIEDLNMSAMSRALSFGKSVHDNGWGTFTRMLEYKCKWHGKHFIKIGKFEPTSQTCHVCGYKNLATRDLKVRKWCCPQCGTYHDRDINAAINIRNVGYRRWCGN